MLRNDVQDPQKGEVHGDVQQSQAACIRLKLACMPTHSLVKLQVSEIDRAEETQQVLDMRTS